LGKLWAWISAHVLLELKIVTIGVTGAIVTFWTKGKVKRWLRNFLDRFQGLKPEEKNLISQSVSLLVLGLGLSKTLNLMGVDWITIGQGALAGLGGALLTFLLTFLVKNPGVAGNIPFGNLFAGIGIVLSGTFRTGDKIELEVDGKLVRGEIQDIGMSRTRLEVEDNGVKQEVLISNSYLSGKNVVRRLARGHPEDPDKKRGT